MTETLIQHRSVLLRFEQLRCISQEDWTGADEVWLQSYSRKGAAAPWVAGMSSAKQEAKASKNPPFVNINSPFSAIVAGVRASEVAAVQAQWGWGDTNENPLFLNDDLRVVFHEYDWADPIDKLGEVVLTIDSLALQVPGGLDAIQQGMAFVIGFTDDDANAA